MRALKIISTTCALKQMIQVNGTTTSDRNSPWKGRAWKKERSKCDIRENTAHCNHHPLHRYAPLQFCLSGRCGEKEVSPSRRRGTHREARCHTVHKVVFAEQRSFDFDPHDLLSLQ